MTILIYVYAFNCANIDDKTYKNMLTLVSAERKKKSERFLKREDSIRSVCSELIVKHLFSLKYPDIKVLPAFIYNEYDKPCIDGFPDFYYNVSHSGDFVVCAIASCEIGVDVEKIDEAHLAVADRFFTKREIDILHNRPENEKCAYFYKLWTAKESYMKCVGKGFSIPLDSFSAIDDNIYIGEQKTDYSIQHYNLGNGYSLSTCCKSREPGKLILLNNLI